MAANNPSLRGHAVAEAISLLKRDCFVASLLAMTVCFAPAAFADDLYFKGLEDVKVLPPRPVQFEPAIVTAQVHASAQAAGIAEVVFFVDGEERTRLKLAVSPEKEEEALFRWEPEDVGSHELKILLDPEKKWDEENRENNEVVVKAEVDPPEGRPEPSTKKKKAIYPYYPF